MADIAFLEEGRDKCGGGMGRGVGGGSLFPIKDPGSAIRAPKGMATISNVCSFILNYNYSK